MGLRISRPQLGRPLIRCQRQVGFALLLEHNANVVEGLRMVGPERNRVSIGRQRLVEPALKFQRVAETEIRLVIIRFERDGALMSRDRFRRPPALLQQRAEIVVALCVAGPKFYRLAKQLFSQSEIAPRRRDNRKIAAGYIVARIERQHLAVENRGRLDGAFAVRCDSFLQQPIPCQRRVLPFLRARMPELGFSPAPPLWLTVVRVLDVEAGRAPIELDEQEGTVEADLVEGFRTLEEGALFFIA